MRMKQSHHKFKTYDLNFSLLFEGRQVRAITVLRSVRCRGLGRIQGRHKADDKCGDHTISSAIFEATSTVSNSFIMENTVLFVTEPRKAI